MMLHNWKIYVPLMIYSATLSMQSNAYGAFIATIPLRRWEAPVSQVGSILGLMMLFAAPTRHKTVIPAAQPADTGDMA